MNFYSLLMCASIFVMSSFACVQVSQQAESSNENEERITNSTSSNLVTLGIEIYEDNCTECHGEFENSNIRNITIDDVNRIINQLDEEEIEAVIAALNHNDEDDIDLEILEMGEELYQEFCSECHDDLESTDLDLTSLFRIEKAIEKNISKRILKDLTREDLQLIYEALRDELKQDNEIDEEKDLEESSKTWI